MVGYPSNSLASCSLTVALCHNTHHLPLDIISWTIMWLHHITDIEQLRVDQMSQTLGIGLASQWTEMVFAHPVISVDTNIEEYFVWCVYVCWKAVQNAAAVKSLVSVDRTQQSATVHYVRLVTTRTSLHRTSVSSASQDHIQGWQHTLFLSLYFIFLLPFVYSAQTLLSKDVCLLPCLSVSLL